MGTVVNPTPTPENDLNTSQQLRHVFLCSGSPAHITPGITLLRSGNLDKCPQCGAPVHDCTNSFLGQSYLAFARLDLGDRP